MISGPPSTSIIRKFHRFETFVKIVIFEHQRGSLPAKLATNTCKCHVLSKFHLVVICVPHGTSIRGRILKTWEICRIMIFCLLRVVCSYICTRRKYRYKKLQDISKFGAFMTCGPPSTSIIWKFH